MSDFWEKNKGSIASGLKTAGKYGYQGTKYVAKTGYKASKNANSRRKEREAKKKRHGEDEEEVDDEDYEDHHRRADSHGRHDSPQGYSTPYQQSYQPHPQPYQQPYQPYVSQYQQQPPQQYQQQPQPYQQSQPQYQQPPQQYQQPPQQYQQPPQQYQQLPQQYQQPPQQYQQPPPLVQPQMAYQQPQQGFQSYSPTNPSQYPDQRFPQDQQFATPLQQPQAGYSNVAAPGGVLGPSSQMPQPPSLLNAGVQQGTHQVLDGSSASVYSRSSVSIPETVASSTVHPLPFSRQRVPSPPLPTRTNNAMAPLAEAPMLSPSSGSPVPGVIPYQKEEMEERKRMQRTPIPQVNLSSLPPPPTHKDRGSLEQKESVTPLPHPLSVKTHGEAIGPHVPSPPLAPNRQESSQSSAIIHAASTSESSVTHNDLPTQTEVSVQKEGIAVETTEPSASAQSDIRAERTEASNSVQSDDIRTERTQSEDMNESRAEGITGKFDYNVKVNYAPPPKPHRSSTATSNASLKQPKSGFSGRPIELNHGAVAPKPPALPRRQTSGSEILPNATIDRSVSDYLPPPKPHRPAERLSESDNSQLIRDETNPRRGPNSMYNSSDNLASYPPPPKPRRRETSEMTSSTEIEELQENHSSSSTPHARGRLQSLNNEHNTARTNSEVSSPKKTPPPPLRPKPKNLSSFGISNDSINTFTEDKDEVPSAGGDMGDITREISQFKLRKTGSTLLMEKNDFVNTASPTPNKKRPVIPPKKESLKKAPPVPAKSSLLGGHKIASDDDASKEDTNPFSVYLKNAVPLENDRLHK